MDAKVRSKFNPTKIFIRARCTVQAISRRNFNLSDKRRDLIIVIHPQHRNLPNEIAVQHYAPKKAD